MRPTGTYTVLYKLAQLLQLLGYVFVAGVASILEWGELLGSFLGGVGSQVLVAVGDRPWLLFCALAAGAAGQYGKRHIGEPWAWSSVASFLKELHQYVFRETTRNDREFHHRVTLFRVKRFSRWWKIWTFSRKYNWLVPVCRYPNLTQTSNTAFRVSENGAVSEGIAGEAWLRGSVLYKTRLPAISNATDNASIESYAKDAFVDKKWVLDRMQEKKSIPRALLGILVQSDGSRWGVIVVDSTHDSIGKIKDKDNEKYVTKVLYPALMLALEPLGRILRRL